jgi:hypothetical protein
VNSKRQVLKAMAVIRRPRDGALLVSESDEPLFQRLLGVLENIFGGQSGAEHEVVFIFSAAFTAASAYEVEEQLILDNPDRRVLWRPADAPSPPLYPAGLSELLATVPADTRPIA